MDLVMLFVGVIVGFLLARFLSKNHQVNPDIMKPGTPGGTAKVVNKHSVREIEDASDGKLVFCRCWRSKTFPFCDGSHVQHNKDTGDNVGPLIVSGGDDKKGK
eukprot:g5079.t1